ncbi:Uncharacterised protein [Yersinia pekkanenii]|uniref:Secreted protein n=1 Tax=Yersinia pekkanenii TaxID=1288385 RepID=A0ABP2A050_9GAMM|nr:Uncharacterised protein [Yersinia pekkanenii]
MVIMLSAQLQSRQIHYFAGLVLLNTLLHDAHAITAVQIALAVIVEGISSLTLNGNHLLQLIACVPLQRLAGLQLLLVTSGIKLTADISGR